VLALLSAPPHAAAQDATSDPSARPATTDVGDLWRAVRHHDSSQTPGEAHKDYIVIAPSIGSKPSTGLNGGFSGNMAFYSGDPQTTRISTFSGGVKVSQKGQTLTGSRLAIFTNNDRWFILGDNRMSWTSSNLYALGPDAPLTSGVNARYEYLKLAETAYHHIRPNLFFGAGVSVSDHWNIRPSDPSKTAQWDKSAFVTYSEQHGFTEEQQISSGPDVGLRLDTRDNGINANRGWLASATYRTYFNGFLGGDSTWQEVYLDVRTYRKLTPDARQKLAFWFLGDMVTGGTAPYLDLPATATDGRSARGYTDGRYRGNQLGYLEAEYRSTLTRNGLFGIVAFANATAVDGQPTSTVGVARLAPAAGFGARVLLNKRSGTNLCTDYAWGKQGARGFYLSIQEAF
jgi:hypothetical protein